MKKKVVISILIILISSLNYITNEELYKLLLSGRSSTYSIILEKNNYALIIALLLIGVVFLIKIKKYKIYCLILFSTIWILSLTTKAIDLERGKCIHGILFVKVYESNLSTNDLLKYHENPAKRHRN